MNIALGAVAAFVCAYLVITEIEHIRRDRRSAKAIGVTPQQALARGLPFRPSRLWAAAVAGELPVRTIQVGALAGLSLFLVGAATRSFALIASGALLGVVVLFAFSQRRRWTLAARVDRQLPEAMTIMANALSAGGTLYQALDSAARESSEPLGGLLRSAVSRCAVNQTVDESLQQLQRESGSRDITNLVAALSIQRTAGGNLAGLLRESASFMREEQRLRGDARALSAQARYSSQMIGFMPGALFVLFWAFFPSYIAPLTDTLPGNLVLTYAAVSTVAGYYVISRIAARIERA